jgi:hypothetical protein
MLHDRREDCVVMNRPIDRYRTVAVAASVLLTVLALYHLGRGFHALVVEPDRALDMHMRFFEMHGFWRVPLDHAATFDPGLEWDRENYLPSSHVLGLVMIPPIGWPECRIYFAVVNGAALAAAVLSWVRLSRPSGPPPWLLIPAVLACSNFQNALAFGQYSIVVVALLSCAVLFLQSGRTAAAVSALVFAAVKPVLCVPLFFSLFAYRKWKVFLGSSAIVGIILVLGFVLSDGSVTTHLRHYCSVSLDSMNRGFGLNTLLLGSGVPKSWVTGIGLATVTVLIFALSRAKPALVDQDPLQFLALTAFAGRAWFPAFSHDNLMCVPMLVALLVRLYCRPSQLTVSLACLTGLSLWIPGKWMSEPAVELTQWLVWLGAAAALCMEPYEPSAGEAKEIRDGGVGSATGSGF